MPREIGDTQIYNNPMYPRHLIPPFSCSTAYLVFSSCVEHTNMLTLSIRVQRPEASLLPNLPALQALAAPTQTAAQTDLFHVTLPASCVGSSTVLPSAQDTGDGKTNGASNRCRWEERMITMLSDT